MIKQEDINKHRYSIIPNQNLLIGENWVSSKSGKTQSIISPIDGKIISELQVANNLDVNEAVLSAREVFDKGHWSNMPPLLDGLVLDHSRKASLDELEASSTS